MTVLIVTRTDDNPSVEKVIENIRHRGGRAFRFDTDRFPTEVRLELGHGRDAVKSTLRVDDDTLDLAEVTALWHRRIAIGGRLPRDLDPDYRRASQTESSATVLGMLASLRVFQLDPLHRIRHSENKPLQLEVARELGLEVPRTLTTNSPDAVRAFAKTCPAGMIGKMLSSFAIVEDGQEKAVYTNVVTEKDLEDLDGLSLCPMTFQELVPKAVELRTTVVGDRVFTAQVDSQAEERSKVDWRRDGVGLLEKWKPYELPSAVEKALLCLMDRFGLNYGAVDFLVTPEGRHVFLEVNPCGEFFWLDQFTGLPISHAIAGVLMGEHRRVP
jgi:MvdD family ATP-grasp ribosomal peptide maturase